MTAKHYPGVVLERQDFPAGRGKKATFAIIQTSDKKKRKSRFSKADYITAIHTGLNPLHSYTYNLATDQASFYFRNPKVGTYHYGTVEKHDEEELLAFLLVTRLRRREKKREKRLESGDNREIERERKRREDGTLPGLSSHLYPFSSRLRLSPDLRERMENIAKKFETAEHKRAARHRKLVNYKR